jgi:4-alpha-glucanotransferase
MDDLGDKAKDALEGHEDQAEKVVDAAGDKADDMTGGKYDEQIDKAEDAAKDRLE